MKRALSLILVLVFCLSLCACSLDFSSQIDGLYDSVFDQVINLGGGLLKEDTSSDDKYNYDDELIESDTNKPGEPIVPDEPNPDEPDEPIIPDEPEPDIPDTPQKPSLIVYQRNEASLYDLVGLNLTSDNHREAGTTYGAVRLYRTLETCVSDSNGYGYFFLNDVAPIVYVDTDLSKLGTTQTNLDYAKALYDFAVTFTGSIVFTSRHVEIGKSPNLTISAQDYAQLLNDCYDGSNGALGEGYGFAEIDPSIKLISGQLSTIDITYIRTVMSEIGKLRTDGFLPIGGWSFSYVKKSEPEKAYLNDVVFKALISYRDNTYANMELHLSEFGWDSVNSDSANYVSAYGDYSSEEMQCAYILRSFMIFDYMGLDRATLKTYKDTAADGSGIVAQNGTKKVAYYALEEFTSISHGMYFKEAIINGENNTYVYRFEDENGKSLYAMWTTTGTAEYTPSVNGTAYTYNGSTQRFASSSYTSSPITLTVMPTFIVAE